MTRHASRSHLLGLGLCLTLLACGEKALPEISCPLYFEANADGHCVGIAPDEPCPGGTMALLGERSCVSIGPQRCPPGSRKHGDGWGCEPILPADPCVGPTREVPGSTRCEPVATCTGTAVSGATHFVDPSFSTLDATHFRTIARALSAAPDGSVIAVAAGIYTENLLISRSISLIGTCPEQTVLQAPALDPGMGLSIRGARGVQISRFTVRGFVPAVGVARGGEASLIQVLLEDNIAYGAIAVDPNSRLTLLRSLVRSTRAGAGEVWGTAVAVNDGARLEVVSTTLADNVGVAAYVSGSGTLQLDGALLLRTRLDASTENDAGIYLHAGGQAWVGDSMIIGSSSMGIVATDPGTQLGVLDSIIADTRSDSSGLSGIGLSVIAGASASVDGLTASGNRSMGVVIRRSSSTLSHLLLRDTLPSDRPWTTLSGNTVRPGTGLWISRGAEVEVTDSASIAGFGSGVYIEEASASFERFRVEKVERLLEGSEVGADISITSGATVSLEGLEINSLHARAVWASDPRTHLQGTRWILKTTQTSSDEAYGGIIVYYGATADLDAVWIDRYSTLAGGVGIGSTLSFNESVIGGTEESIDGLLGSGLYCASDSFLHLRGSEVWGSPHAGLWFDRCGGSLVRSRILDNSVGVRAVEGVTVTRVSELPPTVDLGVLLIDEETFFEGNEVRISSDHAPLPTPPPPPDPLAP